MNEGILQFAIGLETGRFAESLGDAGRKMLEFLGVAEGLHIVIERTFAAFEQGAALQDLSARTGNSVKDLYKLQQAFAAVGLDADAVSPMLLRAQRAMSGISETGESTMGALASLGLNIQQLRQMSGAEQIEAIARALSHINGSQASSIASQLFGREGAGNILQVSRSMKEFSEGFSGAQKGADIFQRASAGYKEVGHTPTHIKMHLGEMWAGLAEGAAPAIQQIENWINNIDFASIGKKFGDVVVAFTQAFRDGTVTELIATAIKSGLEAGLAIAGPIAESIGSKVGFAILRFWSDIDYGAKFKPSSEMTPDELKQFQEGGKLNHAILDAAQAAKTADIDKQFHEMLQKMVKAMQPFNDPINSEVAKAPKNPLQGTDRSRQGAVTAPLDLGASAAWKPEFSQIEKIGYVMGGKFGQPADHAKQTAHNTGQLVTLTRQLLHRFNQGFDPNHLPA